MKKIDHEETCNNFMKLTFNSCIYYAIFTTLQPIRWPWFEIVFALAMPGAWE